VAESQGLDARQPAHVFVVVVLIVLGAHFVLTNVTYLFLSDFVDFDAYYTAAFVFRDRGDPYEREQFFLHENRNPQFYDAGKRAGTVHPHKTFEHVHPYIYPPMLAFLLIPLTLLSKSAAGSVWLCVNLALAAGSIVLLVRTNGFRGATLVALAVVLALQFHALDETLALGQANMVVSFLVFLAVYLFLRGRGALSALALALSIAIKLQPAAFLLYFLLARELRYVAACVAALVLLHAPVLFFLGPDPFTVFAGEVMPMMAGGFANPLNQSLSGFVLRLLGPLGGGGVGRAVAALAALAFLALVVRSLRLREVDHLYNVSLFSVAVLVIAPVTWNAHLVLLLLPILYAVGAWEAGAPVSGRLALAFVLAYVLLGVVATEFYTNRRLTGVLSVFASVRLYGMLLLLYCLHAVRGREAEASRPGP
jgi:alpha-1,2-mannosyltransferase